MKKQRFFKITLLASLLVMIFAAAAAAFDFEPRVIHYVTSSNSNKGLSTNQSTASDDAYILLTTGAKGTVLISVDLNKDGKTDVTASDDLVITWELEGTYDSNFKLSKTTSTIPSGGTSTDVTLTFSSSTETEKGVITPYVRVKPTFEGYVKKGSDAQNAKTLKDGYVAGTSADVYYKILGAPTFTVSPDWKIEVDDEDATTPTLTATSADANGRLRPFRVYIRAGDGIDDPSAQVKKDNEKVAKAYNFEITVSQDDGGRKVQATSPDVGYWYIISGDGSISTTASGVTLKFQAKNAKTTTTKNFTLVIPANTPTVKAMTSTAPNNAGEGKISDKADDWAKANNGFPASFDIPIKTDIGEIVVSVDMNKPITWEANLPSGITLTQNSDQYTAKIKGKFSTEESWAANDIWVKATSGTDSEMTSTFYFPYRLNIGAVPKFDTTAPAGLTTGTPYSTTISITEGTAISWDVFIYSPDVGSEMVGGITSKSILAEDFAKTPFFASPQYFLFAVTSADDGKSITITSSNDQGLRYPNSKKKFTVRAIAYNKLGSSEKNFTISVTPTVPAWIEGDLPSAPEVGKEMDNVFMKFSGALPITFTMDITADEKNNPGITNVSRDLGIYYRISSIDIHTNAAARSEDLYLQSFSDDILVVSASQFRNATKKLKVNVNAKNSAGTATKTFTMDIAGTAPVFSDDQDYTMYVAPKVYLDFGTYTAENAKILKGNGKEVSHDEHWDTTVKGSGPITITAKGFKSPVVYNVGSLDLYGEDFVSGDSTASSVDQATGHLLYVSGKRAGVIAGRAPDKGKQTITLTAQNPAGKATKKINIIVVDDPVISTKKALKKLTVGKEYKAAFKSKAKDVTWKLVAYDIGSGWVTDNASADLLDKTGLTFDEEAGTLTGTMESYPTTGGSSIDLKVAVYNVLEREVNGDFNIPLTLTKPKLNLKGKLDLYVGTEMEEPLTFTAETGALSHCIAPKLPAGLELTGPEGESSPYTYTITGTPEAATMTNGKVKAAKVEIELADRAKQTAKKSISITVHPQKLAIDGEEYTADTMEATATQTFNIELPGEGDQSYKWSIKAAKGYDKVKGLKAAINKSTKTTKDNATLKIDFTTKKSAGGTGTFELIGKNAGDSKVSVSALVSVTVNEATDSAEALKDKDSAEALKDAAEGNEATEATESTSKTETEAADAADAKAKAGITVGGARGESSLTANEKKALEGYVIAAVLPEVTVTEDGQYDIEDVQLKEEIPAGAKLEWFAFPRSASKGDEDIVDFTDNSGAYTEVVPEDHVVTVSPWFNADVVYAPVIAVKADEVNDDDEAKTEE